MLAQIQHLFTPHHTNNHRPRLLHPAGLSVLIGIFLFANASVKLLASTHTPLVRGNVLGYASNITSTQVVSLTNVERSKLGKSSLSLNSTLSKAARAKAEDMFAFDYWAHNNPQTGKQPWAFIREAGYTYRYAGENLARDFGDTPTLMVAWMNSPTHRDNIVSDRYTEIGIAVVNGNLQGIDTTLVIQMFGTPTQSQALTSASTLGEESPPAPPPPTQTAGSKTTTTPVPPLTISKAISMSILLILSLTLLIDYLIIKKRRTIRVSGKNFAHLLLLGALIIIVIVSAPGGIL